MFKGIYEFLRYGLFFLGIAFCFFYPMTILVVLVIYLIFITLLRIFLNLFALARAKDAINAHKLAVANILNSESAKAYRFLTARLLSDDRTESENADELQLKWFDIQSLTLPEKQFLELAAPAEQKVDSVEIFKAQITQKISRPDAKSSFIIEISPNSKFITPNPYRAKLHLEVFDEYSLSVGQVLNAEFEMRKTGGQFLENNVVYHNYEAILTGTRKEMLSISREKRTDDDKNQFDYHMLSQTHYRFKK